VPELLHLGFPGSLTITRVSPATEYYPEATAPLPTLLILEDVLVESGSLAIEICGLLESKLGLFADLYDDELDAKHRGK